MINVVQKIKPYVTLYSSQFNDSEHGSLETIGGKIVNTLYTETLMDDASERGDMEVGVYITIDDGIGEMSVYVPRTALETYKDVYGPITHGDIIIARGKIHILDTVHREKTFYGTTTATRIPQNQTVRLLAYGLVPTPED